MAVTIRWLELACLLLMGAPLLLPEKLLAITWHPYLLVGVLLCHPLALLAQLAVDHSAMKSTQNETKQESTWGSLLLAGLSPLTLPLGVILLWLPINLWTSVDRNGAWIAAGYLLFGIALYSYASHPSGPLADPRPLAFAICGLGSSLALASPLLMTLKPQLRLFYLPLYDRLQTLQLNIGETMHANVVAGALVVTLPIVIAVTVDLAQHRQLSAAFATGISALLILFVLILTQSRGGYLALITGLVTMACLRWPRLTYITPLLFVGALIIVYLVGASVLLDQFSSDGSLGGWSGRIEIWQISLMALADFPFTGIGIGTFTTAIPLLYPLSFSIENYPHAHNLLLQVGMDLGLPGLIAYTALLLNLITMLTATIRSQRATATQHLLAIGAAGGLAGLLMHGLLDAVIWGTKLAFLPWLLFALITQLFRRVSAQTT